MKKQPKAKPQYLETPRGRFVIEDMTHSEAALKGFGIHFVHGDYDIVSDGQTAFAIPKIDVILPASQTSLIPMKEPEKPIDPAILSKRLDDATSRIQKELGSVAKSFVKIGFELYRIRDEKLYQAQGLKNVYEFGEVAFGLKRSSVAMYISVCERFSVHKLDKPTASLMPEFSSFSYGQLQLMVTLPDEEVKQISADTSCKEIREMKKSGKRSGKPLEDPNGMPEELDAEDDRIYAEFTPVEIWNRVLSVDNFPDLVKILKDNIGKNVTVKLEEVK